MSRQRLATSVTLLLLFISYAIVLSVALALAGHRSQTVSASGPPRHDPSRVLIVGATGGTGRQLVTQALERGYTVTALVRDPSRLRVDHPRLTVIQGDVLDEGSVAAAMRGQEAVLSALGHRRYFYPTRILSQGTRNILRAMEAHGVQPGLRDLSRHRRRCRAHGAVLHAFAFQRFCLLLWNKSGRKGDRGEPREWLSCVRRADQRRQAGSSRHGITLDLLLTSISRADVADSCSISVSDVPRTATGGVPVGIRCEVVAV